MNENLLSMIMYQEEVLYKEFAIRIHQKNKMVAMKKGI